MSITAPSPCTSVQRQIDASHHTASFVAIGNSPLNMCVFLSVLNILKSSDSSVGIALGYGLDDWGSKVRFPAGAGNFSLHRCVQNGSEAHPASYTMGTGGSFHGGKPTGAWSWPLTSIWCRGQEWVELYLHSPVRLNGVVLSKAER
jgi:hypothetical protein